MPDETLDETAPEEGQPVAEAVSDASPDAAEPAPEATADASTTTEQPPARLWAGKYKSPEEMELGYLSSQQEASRMAGELAGFKKSPSTDSLTAEPKWKQLEGERNKWAQYLRNPNVGDAERNNADEQVRLYDREIAKQQALHEYRTESRRETAAVRLERESMQVIGQYQTELSDMQSPLYIAAAERLQDLQDMGFPLSNATRAMAVAYAASTTGSNKSKIVQQDRKALLTNLNKQAKQAVIAGAGGPTPVKSGGVSAKDIENMTDAQFIKYEKDLLLHS